MSEAVGRDGVGVPMYRDIDTPLRCVWCRSPINYRRVYLSQEIFEIDLRQTGIHDFSSLNDCFVINY